MQSHDISEQLALRFGGKDLNEANTRHQLIDPLLHDVLGWPRTRVLCEEFIKPGFADYVLTRSDNSALLFIEAKREGHYFSLPQALLLGAPTLYVKVRTLLTDADLAAAINQVREYCLNTGCEFAAVTNGHQWVFFKTFQTGQDWRDLRAFVVANLDYFSKRFTEAHNHLSYNAISERGSLRRLLLDSAVANRELFYPKTKIISYDVPVDSNAYASSLRPITERYFGPIDASDARFMDNCYVSDREYDVAFANARRRLEDALTPFLEKYNIQHFKDSDRGGGFGKRLSKNVIGSRPADVVVLFGGKGVGKSTFLRKLLFHKPPHVIDKNAIVAVIDLLNVSPDREGIQKTIWSGLISALDVDKVVSAGLRDDLCALFGDRFEQATNQDLYGLDKASEAYNLKLNELIRGWKYDHPYVAQRLALRIRARHKGIIAVIDNTDQYEESLQELCFSVGKAIAATFPCVVVISMREERFYSSSIRGLLDAYQNAGFHITSPHPRDVFQKRINYVRSLLREDGEHEGIPERIDRDVVESFFRILHDNFDDSSSHLANMLIACSHGNIRLALALFCSFAVSGYTNVREMTAGNRWTLQIHQVLKPFMVPSRFFYSESLSRIPNIFQIRSKEHGSHFTGLRVLALLFQGHDTRNFPFVPVAKLAMQFVEFFAMRDDFTLNLDMLLKHGLIEANNRLDQFTDAVDSVKITAYGVFLLNALSRDFTYLELTAEDSAITTLQTANEIAELSNDEYRFFVSHKAMERVEVRLKRADTFLSYLEKEEERESQLYRSAGDVLFTRAMRDSFDREKLKVLASARKNIPKKRFV